MVRDEQRLLVGLVPHHEVQRSGALVKRRHVGQQEHRNQGENLQQHNCSVCSQTLVEIIDVESDAALRRPELVEEKKKKKNQAR